MNAQAPHNAIAMLVELYGQLLAGQAEQIRALREENAGLKRSLVELTSAEGRPNGSAEAAK